MFKQPARCEWVGIHDALNRFVLAEGGTQGSGHIKPLHWYVACRLVIEGGFSPDDITLRPPFSVEESGNNPVRRILKHAPGTGGSGERTLLGGLKTKDVDVVVTKDGIGPCVAISLKGTLNAFRNLTNRMEEAVGDCTNLHIGYPALVYGFWHVMRANREGPIPGNGEHFLKPDRSGNIQSNDMVVRKTGKVSEQVVRYHDVLSRLTGRRDVREDMSRYEAVSLTLVSPDEGKVGEIFRGYPVPESQLLIDDFFSRIYGQYDQRFVYTAPALQSKTRRMEWEPDSPVVMDERVSGLDPRVAG